MLRKLVDLLRSDKYTQCKFVFRSIDDCYCILGLMLELARLERYEVDWIFQNEYSNWTVSCGNGKRNKIIFLSDVYGLSSDVLLLLAKMNDGGMSFNQLADYLELT